MDLNRAVIEPAVMADEWSSLTEQIDVIADVATHIQIDVMDGQLVPPFSFPYNKTTLDTQQLPHTDSIQFAAHLMVQHPQEVGLRFIHAGVQRVVAQIEGFRTGEVARVCDEWKLAGAEVMLSIMLDTPLDQVTDFVEAGVVDAVQVMSIAQIGYQGRAFDERALIRIRELRERYADVIIAVDGGVGEHNLKRLFDAGATVFGVGSAIMKADDPRQTLAHLQNLLDSYAQRFQHTRA
tara:strand:+ start:17418 stop:18128 length:711 start_codon:yes stop_codon:yes gene_type:complete